LQQPLLAAPAEFPTKMPSSTVIFRGITAASFIRYFVNPSIKEKSTFLEEYLQYLLVI
jgi:hypothetical protein